MEKRSGRRFRISRRVLILCIMLLSIFALSGITYAATGSTITEHVKIWINGDLVDEKEFESNTDDFSISLSIFENSRLILIFVDSSNCF
jgi:hypothetical protein